MLMLLSFWTGAQRLAGGAWRALKASRPLSWALGALAAALAIIFGVRLALKNARKAGAAERQDEIFDRIERDTRNAIEKIEKAERDLQEEIGPAPHMEDADDGRGLSSDPLNARSLERLRKRAEADPRNRRNPREDPRR